MAKAPLLAGRICRSGVSSAEPPASSLQNLIAKFSQLEHPVTPSKQRERPLSNSEKSEGLHFATARGCFPASNLEPLTSSLSSTFDGYVCGNNRNMICGTLRGGPVSNVLGTRPN